MRPGEIVTLDAGFNETRFNRLAIRGETSRVDWFIGFNITRKFY